MQTIRQEVRTLVLTTERLLSPITLGEPLNEDETGIVAMCAQSLTERYPIADAPGETTLRPDKQEAILHRSHQVTKETRALIGSTRMNIRDSRVDVRKMREQMKESRNAGKDTLAD
jgi:hypothetical protein